MPQPTVKAIAWLQPSGCSQLASLEVCTTVNNTVTLLSCTRLPKPWLVQPGRTSWEWAPSRDALKLVGQVQGKRRKKANAGTTHQQPHIGCSSAERLGCVGCMCEG
jgi:hypothetical protein